jgi:hypothetical protein
MDHLIHCTEWLESHLTLHATCSLNFNDKFLRPLDSVICPKCLLPTMRSCPNLAGTLLRIGSQSCPIVYTAFLLLNIGSQMTFVPLCITSKMIQAAKLLTCLKEVTIRIPVRLTTLLAFVIYLSVPPYKLWDTISKVSRIFPFSVLYSFFTNHP